MLLPIEARKNPALKTVPGFNMYCNVANFGSRKLSVDGECQRYQPNQEQSSQMLAQELLLC